MTACLNLARPSPDRIIEANRPHRRDWLDAHRDYVATGEARYRAERQAHEADDSTGSMAVVGYVLAGAVTVFVMLIGIPMYCLLLAWTGGAL